MVRDANGQTPMLKAAALNRLDMVKTMIEKAQCDPRHVDPYGVSPREKAQLYQNTEMIDYLSAMEKQAKSGEFRPKEWSELRKI